MAVSYSPCSLCKDLNSRRVSTSLSNLYVDLMKLPEKNRKEEIASMLEIKPCAVAKMALFYGNFEFADAFDERFLNETTHLNPCQYRGSETLASGLSLSIIARALREYVSIKDMPVTRESNRTSLSLINETLERNFSTYDPNTQQGISLSLLEEETEPVGFRIIERYK